VSDGPPVLLEVVRSGLVESRHRGSFVLLDADGSVARIAGEVHGPVFPRSTLKPLQAVALLECGYPGRGAELALAAASHDGEDVHRAGVEAILTAAGLAETALQCPQALPSNEAAMLAQVQAGGGPRRLCHNCSGKHAAMLATCVAAGWDTGSYRDPAHPLQVAVRGVVERFADEPVRAVGVDGCGAPAFAVSLIGVARGFRTLATALPSSPAGMVRDAMRTYPRLIGGTGRPVTDLTAGVPGLVCKDGAEAVWGAALPGGRAFAAKIDDGGARTFGPVLCAALRYWDVDGAAVQRWATVPVLGGGEPVGEIRWSAQLRDTLGW
jgi:L-asparaginase II